MGIFATIKEKSYFLGMMVNKLLCTYIGIRKEDDRDNYSNKRVEMAGVLCCELFRTLFKRFIKSIIMHLEKKKQYPDIINIISRTSGITSGLKSCFSTGKKYIFQYFKFYSNNIYIFKFNRVLVCYSK